MWEGEGGEEEGAYRREAEGYRGCAHALQSEEQCCVHEHRPGPYEEDLFRMAEQGVHRRLDQPAELQVLCSTGPHRLLCPDGMFLVQSVVPLEATKNETACLETRVCY